MGAFESQFFISKEEVINLKPSHSEWLFQHAEVIGMPISQVSVMSFLFQFLVMLDVPIHYWQTWDVSVYFVYLFKIYTYLIYKILYFVFVFKYLYIYFKKIGHKMKLKIKNPHQAVLPRGFSGGMLKTINGKILFKQNE